MNVASRPCRDDISFTVVLKRNARSQAESASEWRRLISYWERPNSWLAA